MANSINTNIAAYFAQANISKASSAAQTSVARLSSGNFITKASDDVARLSIGTSFSTTVRTLRQALTNASQGVSLLQVADGALGQITEILQRQKTLAIQASSGNLSSADRGFLNQEFQALSQQIDFITSTTNFNGVSLIDGGLDKAATVGGTDSAASAGSLTISFANTIEASETIQINGTTLTASSSAPSGLQFLIGATTQETVENLAARLNLIATDNSVSGVTAAQRLALGEVKYEASGNSLVITSRSGGAVSDSFRVATAGATTSATTNGEGVFNGQYAGTSFNLFTTASSTDITTTDYVLSDTGGSAAADPFDVDETLKLTVGGVEKTLFTFTSGGGSGTSGAYTLQDLADGINASSGDTGVNAEIVYNGTSYNIRLSYDSLNGIAILDGGDSFNSSTFKLTGDGIDLSTNDLATSAAADATKSVVFSDGYRSLFDADLTGVASAATDLEETSGGVGTGEPLLVGNVIRATVNGTEYVLHTVEDGDTADAIVTSINNKTAETGIYALVSTDTGTALNVRLYVSDPSGGAAASGVSLNLGTGNDSVADSDATTVIAGTATSTRSAVYGLDGGADDGIGLGNTSVTGAIGDDVLTDLSQVKPESRVSFTSNATNNGTLVVGSTTFYFTTTTTGRSADQILIGDSIAETLDNAVDVINQYLADGHAFGSAAYELNQIKVTRDDDTLVFQGKKLDNVLTSAGGNVGISTSLTSITSTTSANLSNAATTYGIKINGVTNSAFLGTVSGFEATYTGTADTVDLSIKVGDYTYTAQSVDITNSSSTAIRLYSDEVGGQSGGYFDLQLRGSEITSLNTQAGADELASRLDAAFSSLSFLQERNVSSYTGGGSFTVGGAVTGSLLNTKVTAQLDSFDDLKLTNVSVTAPTGSAVDSNISLTVNGVQFSTGNDIGTTFNPNQTYRLTSTEDPNQYIEFTTGDTAIVVDSAEKAAAFQSALESAFGFTEGSSALSFQIGTSSADSLSVSIGSATTSSLFAGADLSITTAENAEAASNAIDLALATVTSIRANVGALQSRFNFASANIQISVQNQDASRSELLDTDIAVESTSYATSQVQLQAGISVLAQANQQLQSLLKLLG